MSFTYSDYLKSVGGIPGMTEKQFNEAFGIQADAIAPLQILPKKKPPISPKAPQIKKPKAVKVPPKKKPKQKFTQEELKQRRAERRKEKRAANKLLGLTVDGKPRAQPKTKKTIEEIRADRLRYAKTWRENNREKHLAYRRDYYDRNLKSPNTCLITMKQKGC